MNASTHHSSFGVQFITAIVISALLGVLALSGCRTMEGAGKDIERAGEKIQENAKK
ncbi:entericidin A/B family lipoprotein [Oleiharenicola lentus]|uniref:entericidin A/B family lipoprotein n=1 Tax=Oleiharenicola lentus TaxID=2508720 RepID=UPI003F67FE7F